MKKFIISEDEKRHILSLYSNIDKIYLSEQQTNKQGPKSLTIPLSKNFPSGKYLIKDAGQLTPYLQQVETFLKSVPENQKTTITISAGESLVPNRDGEKPDKPIMKSGELANNRMNEVERVVKEKFGNLPNVTINKTEPKIGTTPWDPKKGADFSGYTQEQFVNLILKVSGTVPTPGEITPPCNQYDFYFGNIIFRTLDKGKATQFLNALAENPQTPLTPNCVNFVGNYYKSNTAPVRNKFQSHFPQTIGTEGQYKIYKSQALYDADPNKNVWIDPIKQYGMVTV